MRSPFSNNFVNPSAGFFDDFRWPAEFGNPSIGGIRADISGIDSVVMGAPGSIRDYGQSINNVMGGFNQLPAPRTNVKPKPFSELTDVGHLMGGNSAQYGSSMDEAMNKFNIGLPAPRTNKKPKTFSELTDVGHNLKGRKRR